MEKKRVGIATIYRTTNYGGTLQAYALWYVISNIEGYTAEIINYSCDFFRKPISIKFLRKNGLIISVATMVDIIINHPRKKGIDKFVDSFASKEYLSQNDLDSLNDRFDIFMSGSDQIWNPDLSQGDLFYLLDFVKDGKKVSYGSSFGKKSIPNEYYDEYKKLISQYEIITVREEAGVDLVEEFTGKKPKVVLDPVLLLKSSEWEKKLPKSQVDGKYIFTYRMAYSTKLTRIVKKAKKVLGISVVASPFLLGYIGKIKNKMKISSLEWVRCIYDSEYVISDSYHAIVFAVVFSKQFYYVITTDTIRNRISRVETLLKMLGLEDRIVSTEKECDFANDIDYNKVHSILSDKRDESYSLLYKMIGIKE